LRASLRRKGVPPALSEASEIVYCLFCAQSEGGEKEIEGCWSLMRGSDGCGGLISLSSCASQAGEISGIRRCRTIGFVSKWLVFYWVMRKIALLEAVGFDPHQLH